MKKISIIISIIVVIILIIMALLVNKKYYLLKKELICKYEFKDEQSKVKHKNEIRIELNKDSSIKLIEYNFKETYEQEKMYKEIIETKKKDEKEIKKYTFNDRNKEIKYTNKEEKVFKDNKVWYKNYIENMGTYKYNCK